jgi:hypothetical protein
MAGTPKTESTKSGDLHIAYRVTGSGPLDLVVMPGFVHPWSARSFERRGGRDANE